VEIDRCLRANVAWSAASPVDIHAVVGPMPTVTRAAVPARCRGPDRRAGGEPGRGGVRCAAGVTAPVMVMGPALAGGYDELVADDLTALVTDPGT
jgi:hypothetical protein